MKDLSKDLSEQESGLIAPQLRQRVAERRLTYNIDEIHYGDSRHSILLWLRCELTGSIRISRYCYKPHDYGLSPEELKSAIKKHFEGRVLYEKPNYETPEDD